MKPVIVLDSGPLGLMFQKTKIKAADDCRLWIKRHIDTGIRVIVPEIINYELRRELLRLGRATALASLADFNHEVPGRFLGITSKALDFAAELWAQSRSGGQPTSDIHDLDIDVILAAQMLTSGINSSEFVVATSNVRHLSLFVPAQQWDTIRG